MSLWKSGEASAEHSGQTTIIPLSNADELPPSPHCHFEVLTLPSFMLATEHYFAYSSSSFWSKLESTSSRRSQDGYGNDARDDAGKEV